MYPVGTVWVASQLVCLWVTCHLPVDPSVHHLLRCAYHILFSLSPLPCVRQAHFQNTAFCCFCLLLCLEIILQLLLTIRALELEPPHQRCLPGLSSMTYFSRVCLIFLHGLHSNMKFHSMFVYSEVL